MSAEEVSVLELRVIELRRSIEHLERSISELKAAMKESGPDPVYREAINEDIVLVAQKKAILAVMEKELEAIRGSRGEVPGPMDTDQDGGGEVETSDQGVWL